MMNKFGKFIAKNRIGVLIVATLLLIPAIIGYLVTPINYDILTYLPQDLDSMKGQTILDGTYNYAATAIIIVEDMDAKDVVKLKDKIAPIEGVGNVVWIDDALDITVPKEFLPEEIREAIYQENSTIMFVTFDNTTSSEETFNAIDEIRGKLNQQCFVSGMATIVKDTKDLMDKETPIYVLIAVILSVIVLSLTNKSVFVPFIFLISTGFCIVYNFGTNKIFGQVSYITQALAAVLQLAVTMDYSIFLMHRYDEEREKHSNKEDAMAVAIQNTIVSISGSSLTTMAGFLALCTMDLLLGKDIGLVMAKGVLFGLIGTVTILPAFILIFDRLIHKFSHPTVLPSFKKTANFLSKHYVSFAILFVLLFIPAIYGNNHTQVYYNLDDSLPKDLPSIVATNKLKEEYNMTTTHFIVIDENIPAYEIKEMTDRIEVLDGIESVIAYGTVAETIPDSFMPQEIKDVFKKDGYQLVIANSLYKAARDEENAQIAEVIKIVKEYDQHGYVAGEGPLTKDLVQIADTDFKKVSIASIGAVFIILLFVFQSISIPIILVSAIELAILLNMGIPYYMGTVIPFIASIVIGCIQLGATVDYAILYTNRYREEIRAGREKMEAARIAIQESSRSIATSALTFFAATAGVGIISDMDMVKSLCAMLSRGAIISMLIIIYILPSLMLVSDKVISFTTLNWRKKPSH